MSSLSTPSNPTWIGYVAVSYTHLTYYAHPDMVKDQSNAVKVVPNYAQVTDQSGELSGWTLSLTQASDLHMTTGTSTDPGYALSGAQISFTGGTLLGGNGITAGKDVYKRQRLDKVVSEIFY